MMEQLVSAGCFERVADSKRGDEFAAELIDLIKKEVSLSKNPQKLMAAAELLCGLLQFGGSSEEEGTEAAAAAADDLTDGAETPFMGAARKKALTQLAIFLCHRYPRVRKATAEKLYEALLTYDDIFGEQEEEMGEVESSSKSELAMTLLSETQWDSKEVNDVKPMRNQLCDLLGIKAPVAVPKKSKE